jgi:PEGA domain
VSHDEGSSKPTEADRVTDDRAPSLRDTQPGVPAEMELSRTLPTGAAFHMTWRSPQPLIVLPNTPASPDLSGSPREVIVNSSAEAGAAANVLATADTQPLKKPDAASPMPNTPASLPKTHAATTKTPVPPAPDGAAPFGTTRKEFGAGGHAENRPSKLSPREKARRNMLTHTLQMPLVIAPLQPMAASSAPRETVRQGSLPAPGAAPGPNPSAAPGWTSMQRIGSTSAPEPPTNSRPAPRHTDPLLATLVSGSRPAERSRQTGMHNLPLEPEQSARPEPASWQRVSPSATTTQEVPSHWVTRMRTGDFERTTLPDVSPIRIPALNIREWLFIGLLACASAATLYSLFVDDLAADVEEDTDAATTIEHVVTPAEPAAEKVPKPAATTASTAKTTEIVSDPPHAEVVLGGAVIGNTPAQVVRGPKEADYLLRKQGYESQLVRVTPHSGNSISITLRPKQP